MTAHEVRPGLVAPGANGDDSCCGEVSRYLAVTEALRGRGGVGEDVAAVTVDEDAGGPDQISPTLRSLLVRHVPVMPTLGRHPEWAPIPTEDMEPPRWVSTGGAVGHFAGFQGVPVLRAFPGITTWRASTTSSRG
jgi:hypothetical protein